MRIALLCSEYPPGRHGGIGTYTQIMARELTRRGHSVRVAGIYGADSAREPQSLDGVHVWKIPASERTGGWVQARVELYRMVAEWALQDKIDMIEAPDYEGLIALWPRLPVPVIVRLHGSATYFCLEVGQRPPAQSRVLERLSLKRADYCSSSSRYTAQRTIEKIHPRLRVDAVIYNGIEPAERAAKVRSRFRIVFTGTLIPKKGVFELAAAWPMVQERVPEAELHLYGRDGHAPDGSVSSQWLANRLVPWWGRTVHYHGFADRLTVFDALATARSAVFPSMAEAFALAPLEAMARGCPTIYSSLSSGPELIAHRQNGLLVDPRSPAELAAAIVSVLEDDALAERLSSAGRRHIEENFMAGHWARRNEEFYLRCVHEFQNRRQVAKGTFLGNANVH